MEIIKYYKNYTSLKKELFARVGIYTNKTIKIRCYTSLEDDILATDLELEIFSQDDIFMDSLTIASIETIDFQDWNKTVAEQRKFLLPEKQKLFNYLSEIFPNVLSCEDYSL